MAQLSLRRRGLLLGGLALSANGLLPRAASAAASRTVYNGSQLQDALRKVKAGETIVLAPGNYGDSGVFQLATPGVSLRAAAPLQAILRSSLVIAGAGSTVSGLAFEGGGVQIAANAARVLDCRVRGTDYVGIQIVRGGGAEIGYCEVAGFKGRGISVKLWRERAPSTPWIHHNHIHDSLRGGSSNEGIQLAEAMKDSNTRLGAVVEYNLLDNVEAESEAISVKCSGNQVRFNTLQDSRAYIVNRHGQGNVYAGNTVQRAYGIAIQDGSCKLLGNRCTGSILKRSIRLLCGNVDAGSTRQGSHPAAADTYLCGNVADYLIVGDQFNGGFRVPVEGTTIANHSGRVLLEKQVRTNRDGGPVTVPSAVLVTAADVGPRRSA